jgi:hypothetical protein
MVVSTADKGSRSGREEHNGEKSFFVYPDFGTTGGSSAQPQVRRAVASSDYPAKTTDGSRPTSRESSGEPFTILRSNNHIAN